MKFHRRNISCDAFVAYDFSGAGVIMVVRALDEDGGETDEEEAKLYLSIEEAREEARLLLAFAQLAEDRATLTKSRS